MLILKKTAMAAAILASFGITGMAHAVAIDLFDSGTVTATDLNVGGAVTVFQGSLSNVIGGARAMSSDMTDGAGASNKIATSVSSGFFDSTRDTGVKGISTIWWDGSANASLDKMGLGGVDLMSFASWFELLVDYDNAGGPIDLTVWDMDGDGSKRSFSSAAATGGAYKLDFSLFDSNIDFYRIGAIQLSMDTFVARSLQIDSLITAGTGTLKTPNTPGLPEPATLALLGLGLAGLGWSKRRHAV